jgi:hypothetical protein
VNVSLSTVTAHLDTIAEHSSQTQVRALKGTLLGVVVPVLTGFAFARDPPHEKPARAGSSEDEARALPEAAAA